MRRQDIYHFTQHKAGKKLSNIGVKCSQIVVASLFRIAMCRVLLEELQKIDNSWNISTNVHFIYYRIFSNKRPYSNKR